MHFSTLLAGSGLVSLALAGYTLKDDYSGDNFFNMFTFDTENDPTNGYVNYVDKNTAMSSQLASSSNGVVTLKADSSNVASGRGRNSVRVTSVNQYTHGLVILDLEHMPGNACGIWPAFWMTGPNWPNNGEIDIIEGVNLATQNSVTMHSSQGCTMVNKNCQGNQGCGVQLQAQNTFGDSFNGAQGGVYAMQWTSNSIDVWFFSRSNVPGDVSGGSPNPSGWGTPGVSFEGGSGCDLDQHFQNNNLVFDTTFCGDWAGSVWSQDPTCSAKASSCQAYVQNNPSAFNEAYWTINSLKVYTDNGQAQAANAAPTPSPSPAAVASPAAEKDKQPAAPAPPAATHSQPKPATPPPVSAPKSVPNPATEPASKPAPASSGSSSGAYAIGSTTQGGPEGEHAIEPAPSAESSQIYAVGSTTPGGPLREYAVPPDSSPVETRQVSGGVKTVVVRSPSETVNAAAEAAAAAALMPRALTMKEVLDLKTNMRVTRHMRRHRGFGF